MKALRSLRHKRPDRLSDHSTESVVAWLYGAGGAPSEKFIRCDYDSDGETVGSLQVALSILGNLAPSLITPGHSFRIVQDFQNSRIILSLVPRNGDVV